jgi:hypothetical protein
MSEGPSRLENIGTTLRGGHALGPAGSGSREACPSTQVPTQPSLWTCVLVLGPSLAAPSF